MQNNNTLGWGVKSTAGAEIWDSEPIFKNEKINYKDWLKLLFYPKKWFLYRWVKSGVNKVEKENNIVRVLDVGCGTGASLVDFKRIFGRKVEVYGVEVVRLQVDLAKEKISKYGVWSEVKWYDGQELPFSENYFDAIYTSDVLGHVADVRSWLGELNRVLKSGGTLAMFAESKLGKHAYIRNYLSEHGLNVDPHAEFHISLYSKNILQEYLEAAGFQIKKMYSAFWASFLVHPDEFYHALQRHPERSPQGGVEGSLSSRDVSALLNMTIRILKFINKVLYKIKKKLHPYSTALCELYGLVEMYLVGRFVEAQGYVILAKKK